MPPSTLSVGPGDSTEVEAPIYDLVPADYAASFRVKFKDVADNTFVSNPFKPCVQN